MVDEHINLLLSDHSLTSNVWAVSLLRFSEPQKITIEPLESYIRTSLERVFRNRFAHADLIFVADTFEAAQDFSNSINKAIRKHVKSPEQRRNEFLIFTNKEP